MADLIEISSTSQFEEAINTNVVAVVHFWASWCEPCKQMDAVLTELKKDFPAVKFLKVEAEVLDDLTERYSVATVPYVVILKGKDVLDTVEGADPPLLTKKLSALVASSPQAPAAAIPQTPKAAVDINTRIKQLLDSSPVLLFMKGTPDAPRCGFSTKVVDVLKQLGVQFQGFDILSDEEVRQGLKEYSNWPTYPQLYVKGELLGGCDIVQEMHQSGELKKHLDTELGAGRTKASLQERIQGVLGSAGVMLFMKGTVEQPRCGYSRKVVEALQKNNVQFKTFDILSDEEVRQGLKEYSNWPTYPQLYVKGELLGGCDIVQELEAAGELKQEIQNLLQADGGDPVKDRIQKLLGSQPIMLFMKGSPEAPACGFSGRVVAALRKNGIQFGSFDILSDGEIRDGLKEYSNWPTYPQLYVKGELLGGCDIVQELDGQRELNSTIDEMLHRTTDV